MPEKDLRFDDFHTAVGRNYSERRVRFALRILGKSPYTLAGDMRVLRYDAAWVPQVQKYLEDEDAQRR